MNRSEKRQKEEQIFNIMANVPPIWPSLATQEEKVNSLQNGLCACALSVYVSACENVCNYAFVCVHQN